MATYYCSNCDCVCDVNDPCDCERLTRDDQERTALEMHFVGCGDACSYIEKLKEAWLMGAPVSTLVSNGA